MATSYTATFSSAVSAKAPAVFDTNATQKTGAVCTGIGLGAGAADGTPLTPPSTYIGGAAQVINVETTGDPNA